MKKANKTRAISGLLVLCLIVLSVFSGCSSSKTDAVEERPTIVFS